MANPSSKPSFAAISRAARGALISLSDVRHAFQSGAFELPLWENRTFRRMLSLVLFFGIWQILCMANFKFFINFSLMPSPVEVFGAHFTGAAWLWHCLGDRHCARHSGGLVSKS